MTSTEQYPGYDGSYALHHQFLRGRDRLPPSIEATPESIGDTEIRNILLDLFGAHLTVEQAEQKIAHLIERKVTAAERNHRA